MLVCTMPSRFARADFGVAISNSGAAGDSPVSDSDPITDGRFVMLASLRASVRPLPKRADFLRRFTVRRIFRDPEPGRDGVLKLGTQRQQRSASTPSICKPLLASPALGLRMFVEH